MLRLTDLADAVALSSPAGWNQTARDWQLLLDLAPEGCFGLRRDGRVVATTTLIPYGSFVAWIGMVLTHPDFRRQGLARALVTAAIERADALGVATVKLDATEEGRPLYQSLGFRSEQPIERWYRAGTLACDFRGVSDLPDAIAALDYAACGYDRMALLRRLAEISSVVLDDGGYLFARPGRLASYIGPVIAADRNTALRMISGILGSGAWFWDVLPGNADAVALAQELGFAPVRHLTRMVRGPDCCGSNDQIYAIAGFEFG